MSEAKKRYNSASSTPKTSNRNTRINLIASFWSSNYKRRGAVVITIAQRH